jgi:hypothetical protein
VGKPLAKAVLAITCVVSAIDAPADQGGVAFWFSAQFASMSAVPPSPGGSLAFLPYYYNGSASASETFQTGERVSAGLASHAPLVIAQVGYAPETRILDGQPHVALGWGAGGNRTSAEVTIAPVGEFGHAESIDGGTDLYPFASLAWDHGDDNWMAHVTGDVPTGAYDSRRLANLGFGHAAIDAGGGYTYLNAKSGLEFSAVADSPSTWKIRAPNAGMALTATSIGRCRSSCPSTGKSAWWATRTASLPATAAAAIASAHSSHASLRSGRNWATSTRSTARRPT